MRVDNCPYLVGDESDWSLNCDDCNECPQEMRGKRKMYRQIKISRTMKCPICGEEMEWTAGKNDETTQEFMCRKDRIYVDVHGFTPEDQENIAEEAFM